MNKNEKRAKFLAETDAPHTKMKILKQNHNNPNTPNFQPQRFSDTELERMRRREMLESTRLSRLPSLPKRRSFVMPKFEPPQVKVEDVPKVCANCNIRLTEDNQKTKANVCTTCVLVYTKIACEIDRTADEKVKAAKLAKFGGCSR